MVFGICFRDGMLAHRVTHSVSACVCKRPSDVCVWSMDTRVHTHSSLSIFTTLSTAVLSSLYTLVWLFIRKTHLSSTDPIMALA